LNDWYEIEAIGDGITIVGEPLHEENIKSYLIEGERDVAVIDTGLGVGDFAGAVRSLSEKAPIVLQTHGHWDHIGGSHAFERVMVHESEAYALRRGFPNAMYAPLFTPRRVKKAELPASFDLATAAIPPAEPTGMLDTGDTVDLGGRVLEVFHTPGHSQGGLSFLDQQTGFLFAGDAVNYGGMWLFLPRSDPAAFRETARLLAGLADRVSAVYPAHGKVPLPPDDLRRVHEQYEEIWAGRKPDRHVKWDIGFPERVPVDVHDFGEYTYLMGAGRYGGEATPERRDRSNVGPCEW
jgi:glyoxylase-like metal-dependent hydrolase (beta-lactamase superfamily II)